MRRVMILLTGAAILGLSGCAKYEIPTPECPEGDRTAKFSSVIQPIFDKSCVACHSGGQAPDLSEGWAYDELMDGDYINTDFPCESILYQIFSGTHSSRGDDGDDLKILGWIQEGAKDN